MNLHKLATLSGIFCVLISLHFIACSESVDDSDLKCLEEEFDSSLIELPAFDTVSRENPQNLDSLSDGEEASLSNKIQYLSGDDADDLEALNSLKASAKPSKSTVYDYSSDSSCSDFSSDSSSCDTCEPSTKITRDGERLLEAARERRKRAVYRLLRSGTDVNYADEKGDTALMICVRGGNENVVKLLLKHKGIDVNRVDENGDTALMHSVRCSNVLILGLLLNHEKINIDVKNNKGESALMMALYFQKSKRAISFLQNHYISIMKRINSPSTSETVDHAKASSTRTKNFHVSFSNHIEGKVVQEISQIDSALAPNRQGLNNHLNNGYMNSVVSILFNNHGFRNAMFATTSQNSTSRSVSQVFAKMLISPKPVRTDMCLMQAMKEHWTFGPFHDILEFTGVLLDLLPESIQGIFQQHNRYSILKKSNDQVLNVKLIEDNMYIVPKGFSSVSEAISLNFIDHEAEDYKIKLEDYHYYEGIIQPFTEPFINIPIYNEMTIMNRPEMLMFGINRVKMNPEISFDESEMKIDFAFELPGLEDGSEPIMYLLTGFSFFQRSGHYMSYVRDLSRGNPIANWFLYNDSLVTIVQSSQDLELMRNRAKTAACLLFYSRQDTIECKSIKSEIPEDILANAKNMMLFEDNS